MGYLVVKNGRGGTGFKIGGYIVMLIMGFTVSLTGITVENGAATLTDIGGGVIDVTPEYDSVQWGELFIGAPFILMGLLGIFLTVAEQKDSNNPYAADGVRPPA